MKQLEQLCKRAMQVKVPAGLAERICSGKPCCKTVTRKMIAAIPSPWHGAGQAPDINIPPDRPGCIGRLPARNEHPLDHAGQKRLLRPLSLAQVAMAHVYGEKPFIQGVDERVNLYSINSQDGEDMATLSDMPGLTVTYVNHCSFYQGPALHMVIQGKMGPIHPVFGAQHVPLTLQQASFCRWHPQRGDTSNSRGQHGADWRDERVTRPRCHGSCSHVCTGTFNKA
ncbi:DUF3379 family protein [Aeromonas sp. A-5]|uniref:DUF3379 family protein n=1 Tax=Aeromonas ichthyocola TaxID=3367746 RepID=UPI0038DC80F9